MAKAVLFKSIERFDSFRKKLESYGIDFDVVDFEDPNWIEYDFLKADFAIFYPSFNFSSNHPLALWKVYDHMDFLAETYPHLALFPDPKIVKYYNDKYRQYLFLRKHRYPVPETIPLYTKDCIPYAEKKLGYPMVLKNRHGAGGGAVFMAHNRAQVKKYFRLTQLDILKGSSLLHFIELYSKRVSLYWLIKRGQSPYPFFSPPLLAQKFVTIDRDLKTVVGGYEVVEAHWRLQADEAMWKMNIDGGGIGVWGFVPQEAIDLSNRLAKQLNASWLNIDLISSNGQFMITEFSPVWHHYAYREKPSFVYNNDYNIDVPLEVSLDLEKIIIDSLLADVEKKKS